MLAAAPAAQGAPAARVRVQVQVQVQRVADVGLTIALLLCVGTGPTVPVAYTPTVGISVFLELQAANSGRPPSAGAEAQEAQHEGFVALGTPVTAQAAQVASVTLSQ